MCEITQTTSASMARNVALPWVVLPLSRLPPTLLVAWAHPGPGREMLGGRKPRHIIANFRQNSRRSKGGNAGNTHEQGHGLLQRAEVLLDLLLQLLQGLFQKDDMSQNMFE